MSDVSVGAAQSYIEGVFGGPTEESDSEYTVDATASRITNNDPEALALTIINLGAAEAFVLFDQNVSSTRGIILQPGGGPVTMNVRDDQTLPTREWWAICPTGSTTLFVLRTRRFALTGTP